MKHGSILVTGGAGYIGSHVALQLRARGERVLILDDLSRGFRQAALDTPLIVGAVGDRERVRGVLKEHGVDTVMHFAAYTIVPESVREPLKYYRNNTCATGALLECCLETQVRHFVFSSTAAVYGVPAEGVAAESTPTAPINPYGTSKLMSEWMLADLGRAGPGTRERWWRAPIASAPSSAGGRASMTSIASCAARSPGRSGCCATPGECPRLRVCNLGHVGRPAR